MTHDQLRQLADKLDKLLDRHDIEDIHVFSPEEVAEIQRVLVFVRRLDALAWWAKWAFWLAGIGGTAWVNRERMREFILSLIGGGQP